MPAIPNWATALGPALFAAHIRSTPADFVVTELLDIELSDTGEHDWLCIEKTGANTVWVAEQLARHANVAVRDVGYAGLKDRHAVTQQWFSVRRPNVEGTDWHSFEAEGVRMTEHRRHHRKLRRGAHRGNAFRIALRGDVSSLDHAVLDERLNAIASRGIPNYFGEQRFGRDGGNIDLGRAALAGKRLSRHKRSIGISALRSFEFNTTLDARVRDDTWDQLVPGDVANLDGTGSVFEVGEVTPELKQRCAELDIHPAGLLPGFESIRVAPAYRPLRARVIELTWEFGKEALWLGFRLGKGCYATGVLREVAAYSSV